MAANKRATPDVGFLTRSAAPSRESDLFATATAAHTPVSALVPTDLEDNPYQPRLRIDPAGIQELATVIQTQGFQGVLVARPHPTTRGRYQLAWGHRRRDAAQAAGLATIPVMVQPLTDEDMLEVALTENIQREDLTPLEEGMTFNLMLTKLEYTYEQVAGAVGKGKGYVQNRVRLARAPADVQAFITRKPDSLRAVATLVTIDAPPVRAQVIQQLLAGRLTTDDIPGYLDSLRSGGPAPAGLRAGGLPNTERITQEQSDPNPPAGEPATGGPGAAAPPPADVITSQARAAGGGTVAGGAP
nr:ParB/RepB/Spo0J family partition protein [Chloroflexota bacterium]